MAGVQPSEIILKLQADILRLQGFKPASDSMPLVPLGAILEAFPQRVFPTGAVHEFLTTSTEDQAVTAGFISAIAGSLMRGKGVALWIGGKRQVFPPALTAFGIPPHQVVFIEARKEKQILWSMEEALKCSALSVVVGEVSGMSFTATRRLQLAVEESRVTGLIMRATRRKVENSACVSRWRITSLPSMQVDGLPGVGFPSWKVELLRMRNGKCGVWEVTWRNGRFGEIIPVVPAAFNAWEKRKAG